MYFVQVRKPRSVHVSVLPFDDLPRTDIVEVGLRDRINQLTKEEKQKKRQISRKFDNQIDSVKIVFLSNKASLKTFSYRQHNIVAATPGHMLIFWNQML